MRMGACLSRLILSYAVTLRLLLLSTVASCALFHIRTFICCLTGPPGPEDPAQPWPFDTTIGDILYKHVFIDPDHEKQPGFVPPASSLPEEVSMLVFCFVPKNEGDGL